MCVRVEACSPGGTTFVLKPNFSSCCIQVAGKTVGSVAAVFAGARPPERDDGSEGSSSPHGDDMLPDADVPEPTELLRTLPPLPDAVNAWDALERRGFVDLEKNACLLCKRQLPSREKLELHASASALHATNAKTTRDKVLGALRSVVDFGGRGAREGCSRF